MKPLNPRERKLVAIAILVALLAVVWAGVIAPLADGFSARADRRQELLQVYAANDRLIGNIGHLRRVAEQQAGAQAPCVLGAADLDSANEALKERLSTTATALGGEIRAADAIETRPGWAAVGVSAVMTRRQLIDWLRQLSATPPWLVVNDLQISADRAINSNHADLLDVKLTATIPFHAQPATPSKPR